MGHLVSDADMADFFFLIFIVNQQCELQQEGKSIIFTCSTTCIISVFNLEVGGAFKQITDMDWSEDRNLEKAFFLVMCLVSYPLV